MWLFFCHKQLIQVNLYMIKLRKLNSFFLTFEFCATLKTHRCILEEQTGCDVSVGERFANSKIDNRNDDIVAQ